MSQPLQPQPHISDVRRTHTRWRVPNAKLWTQNPKMESWAVYSMPSMYNANACTISSAPAVITTGCCAYASPRSPQAFARSNASTNCCRFSPHSSTNAECGGTVGIKLGLVLASARLQIGESIP